MTRRATDTSAGTEPLVRRAVAGRARPQRAVHEPDPGTTAARSGEVQRHRRRLLGQRLHRLRHLHRRIHPAVRGLRVRRRDRAAHRGRGLPRRAAARAGRLGSRALRGRCRSRPTTPRTTSSRRRHGSSAGIARRGELDPLRRLRRPPRDRLRRLAIGGSARHVPQCDPAVGAGFRRLPARRLLRQRNALGHQRDPAVRV